MAMWHLVDRPISLLTERSERIHVHLRAELLRDSGRSVSRAAVCCRNSVREAHARVLRSSSGAVIITEGRRGNSPGMGSAGAEGRFVAPTDGPDAEADHGALKTASRNSAAPKRTRSPQEFPRVCCRPTTLWGSSATT